MLHFDGKEFKEDLLALIPMEGHTTGDIIVTKLSERFERLSLSFEKINLLVTEAASMLGKHRGLVG